MKLNKLKKTRKYKKHIQYAGDTNYNHVIIGFTNADSRIPIFIKKNINNDEFISLLFRRVPGNKYIILPYLQLLPNIKNLSLVDLGQKGFNFMDENENILLVDSNHTPHGENYKNYHQTRINNIIDTYRDVFDNSEHS